MDANLTKEERSEAENIIAFVLSLSKEEQKEMLIFIQGIQYAKEYRKKRDRRIK